MWRKLLRWARSFRRGPIYGLSARDLRRVARDDRRPLQRIPSESWIDAIEEVPLPRWGYDSNLNLDALLALCRRRIDSKGVSHVSMC